MCGRCRDCCPRRSRCCRGRGCCGHGGCWRRLVPEWVQRYPVQITMVLLMIILGAASSYVIKLVESNDNMFMSAGRDKHDHKPKRFYHPYFMIFLFNVVNLLCLPLYYAVSKIYFKRYGEEFNPERKPLNWFYYLFPSLLQMLSLILMYITLILTFDSSYQVLCGIVIFLTAMLSVSFIRRKININMWLGMGMVSAAGTLYSVADILYNKPWGERGVNMNIIMSGELLVWVVLIMVSVQMMYEEKFFSIYNAHAMEVAGIEGLFGCVIMGLFLIPAYFIRLGAPFTLDYEMRLENALDAGAQMGNNKVLMASVIGGVILKSAYNAVGLYVTKEISATSRILMDSLKVILLWSVATGLGPDRHWRALAMQSGSFALQVIGLLVYHSVVFYPILRRWGWVRDIKEPSPDDFRPVHETEQRLDDIRCRPMTEPRSAYTNPSAAGGYRPLEDIGSTSIET